MGRSRITDVHGKMWVSVSSFVLVCFNLYLQSSFFFFSSSLKMYSVLINVEVDDKIEEKQIEVEWRPERRDKRKKELVVGKEELVGGIGLGSG